MSTNYRELYQLRHLVCVSDYVCVVDIGMFELSLRTSDGRDVVSHIVIRHESVLSVTAHVPVGTIYE